MACCLNGSMYGSCIHIGNLSINIEYKISSLIYLTIEELKCLGIKRM